MGAQLFAREFQNQVQDDSAAAFRYEWLEAAKERGKHLSLYELPDVKGLELVQGWDFSLVSSAQAAEARDTDFTVGTTWGRDPATGDHYLLGLFRKRGLQASQLRDAVVSEFERWRGKVRAVAVELALAKRGGCMGAAHVRRWVGGDATPVLVFPWRAPVPGGSRFSGGGWRRRW